MVHGGDLVRITVVNRGFEPHPMHPHGHAVLVLARNGLPASGPVWTDSFDVGPGEVWTVALRADNPGIWMSHCHNLEHARAGMVLHLAYAGVDTRSRLARRPATIPRKARVRRARRWPDIPRATARSRSRL